ncbi:hypothetical protein ACTNDY_13310 [Tissierellaceae bacterium HCP3S3_D8]
MIKKDGVFKGVLVILAAFILIVNLGSISNAESMDKLENIDILKFIKVKKDNLGKSKSEIANLNFDTATPEMKLLILDARANIIHTKTWTILNEDTGKPAMKTRNQENPDKFEDLPLFEDVFPGWNLEKIDKWTKIKNICRDSLNFDPDTFDFNKLEDLNRLERVMNRYGSMLENNPSKIAAINLAYELGEDSKSEVITKDFNSKDSTAFDILIGEAIYKEIDSILLEDNGMIKIKLKDGKIYSQDEVKKIYPRFLLRNLYELMEIKSTILEILN